MNKMLIAVSIVMTMFSCAECPKCPECPPPSDDWTVQQLVELSTDATPPYPVSSGLWTIIDKRNGVKYEVHLVPVKQ